ncbi:MAG TPA: tRNA pseudouridine(55) synthase TruB [Chloroflexota bacterium]|nr:tRNA pseudouridine(55) synthase TruB [Chloroflexota bacterium]
MPQVDGFLNVCKPLGWTSHDVVGFVRRRVGQQRVGHAGTLDPAATGVLPLCLGRATRLADRVAAGAKLYAADVVLGFETDSCDAEGRALLTGGPPASAVGAPSLDMILQALAELQGEIQQVPPHYSAVKVGGEAAYARARRGEAVALAPRPVTVHGTCVLAWEPPRLSLLVRCSRGTYVRALARDVGARVGCGAYLDALVRLAVGGFTLAGAIALEELEEQAAAGRWEVLVDPPDRAAVDLPAAILGAVAAAHFAHGRAWDAANPGVPRDARAYGTDGRFLGLLRAGVPPARWQPALSFVYDAGAAVG